MRGGLSFLAFFLWVSLAMAGPSRLQLAEAWAPVIYADISPEYTQIQTGFNPVDHLVGLFFDDMDVRNNGESIFRVSDAKARELLSRAQVYYSVIETDSHWYINYILYHAVDMNSVWSHTHDAENVWMVIKKDENFFGSLVSVTTNSHGHPRIYSSEPKLQKKWRKKVEARLLVWSLKLMDRFSGAHDKGQLELLDRARSQSPVLFVASKTHAIYKFSSEAWREKKGEGVVYIPLSCREHCEQVGWIAENPAKRIAYQLVDWDEIHRRFFRPNQNVFAASKKPDLPIREAKFFPRFLLPAFDEDEARALLFHSAQFRTPYPLSDPARVHRFFEDEDEAVSLNYVYNPYKVLKKRSDPWSKIAESWLDLDRSSN